MESSATRPPKELRYKAYRDLRTVELPYVPGDLLYRLTDTEIAYILDGYIGFDGVRREGCHILDAVPMMYLRNNQWYTAPHIASVIRYEIMSTAAAMALKSTDGMKTFLDYVWYVIGNPPEQWTLRSLYDYCIDTLYVPSS